jgi:Glycosyltransferase like family
VIAFGSSIQGAEAYRRYAEPGVRHAAEPDSEIYAFAAIEPVGRTYNLILDRAAQREDLEALVLVHPHTEIVDEDLPGKVRHALRDPDVGIVGCAGATGIRGIAWWEGEVTAARVRQHYGDFGGGELPGFSWITPGDPPAEVQAVDGQLLVLSPWAVRNLRFDESLFFTHGFDVDFCLQALGAGRKLVVADLRVVYHRSIELVKDLDVWAQAHIQVAEKWDAALNGVPAGEQEWKQRARYAEADREAARAIAFSKSLVLDARVLELERELEDKTRSLSWRITAPLRAANQRWRELRAPGRG